MSTEGQPAPRPTLEGLADPVRVAAVARVVAGGPVGERLDLLAALAADLLDAPFAQVSLLTGTEQVVAAAHGLRLDDDNRRGPLESSLCTVTAASGGPLVVDDARDHAWVRDLPPVTSGSVVAYLGVVLRDPEGNVLGSVCVFAGEPRSWTTHQVGQLASIAGLVGAELGRHVAEADATAAGLLASATVDAAELGSFVLDLSGDGGMRWDERMCSLHGVAPGSFRGRLADFEQTVHPDDLPGVRQRFAHARDTLGELVVDYRVVLPHGRVRWLHARGRVVPDMLGRPSRALGAAYDASTERGLRDELTQLMETMPAGLVRIDRDWRVTYVNHVAERLHDRLREQLLGRPVWEAFPDILGTATEKAYREVMDSGERGVVEAHFLPHDLEHAAHVEVQVWPDDHGLTLFFHDVSDRVRAHAEVERAGERLRVLADAGSRLAGSLRPQQVLGVLADVVVPQLASALVVVVTDRVAELVGLAAGNDPHRLHAVRVRHVDPDLERDLVALVQDLELRDDAESGVGRAVRTRQAEHHLRVPEEVLAARAADAEQLARMRALSTGPQLSIPLVGSRGVLGAFTAASTDDRPLDEVLLRDLATRAAAALDNALTFSQQSRAATVLQRALLPPTSSPGPDVQIATRYLPATTDALAGGDFFRTVNVDGRLVCAIGDVMGHGLASAARAGQLHGLVAALALQGLGPAALLTRLSAGIDELMDLQLATLLVCSYDLASRELTCASAGHPPPLLAPVAGDPAYLDLEPGAPIGVAADSYVERTVALGPGSTAVLFSDGLVERRHESITDGLERLRVAVRELRLPPEAVADHVLDALDARDGDDDVALLVLSHL